MSGSQGRVTGRHREIGSEKCSVVSRFGIAIAVHARDRVVNGLQAVYFTQELFEHLAAKIGFDKVENEPCKVCPLSVYRVLLLLLEFIDTPVFSLMGR